MSSSIWQKYEDIFPLVADLPADEREARLAELCRGDEWLRREILTLLRADEKAAAFIESPIALPDSFSQLFSQTQTGAPLTSDSEGQQFGTYRAVKKLGSGGMGTVYLAERADGEFRKQAAIKLVKRGADTDFNLRRFRHERQILASLEHPNIARLIDGGTTETGVPYLVMEYVEGKTIFDFCAERNLDVRERLQMFRQICAAIAYAHARGIIHRDIKPGNILVTADGTPKLLDFGIAKILDAELIQESIENTATLMRQMTPQYASPEQIKGEPVTAASDVYSLGVCLYELLTGERPYNFTSRAPHEIARVICEQAVRIPKINLENPLSDEVKYIVLKSLQKKPLARYASVDEFDRDIEKFLDGVPVQTAKERLELFEESDSDDEQLEKTRLLPNSNSTADVVSQATGEMWKPRRLKLKWAAAGSASIILSVLLFYHFVYFRGFKIVKLPHNQPAVAGTQQKTVENKISLSHDAAANEFYQSGKQQLETRTMDGVNRAIKFFTEATKRDENFALAFSGLADAHIVLADKQKEAAPTAYRKAEEYSLKALALDPDLAEARTSLAMSTYKNTGNFAAAEKHFLRAIEINPSLSRAHHWYSIGLRVTGQLEAALREIKIAADLEPRSAVIRFNVGVLSIESRRYAEAIEHFDKTLELDSGYVSAYLSKAIAQQALGNYDGAVETYRIGRIYTGKDENEPLWILLQAQAHAANGRRGESLALLNRVLRNPAHREETKKLPFDIAMIYALLGDADTACEWLEKIEVKLLKEADVIASDPRFANLHGNERFIKLTEKWRTIIGSRKSS